MNKIKKLNKYLDFLGQTTYVVHQYKGNETARLTYTVGNNNVEVETYIETTHGKRLDERRKVVTVEGVVDLFLQELEGEVNDLVLDMLIEETKIELGLLEWTTKQKKS